MSCTEPVLFASPAVLGAPTGGSRCGWGMGALGLVAALVMGCRYQLGLPPASTGMMVGSVQAPVAEPGIADALSAALGAAIRRAGAGGDRAILARIDRASYEPTSSRAGQVLVWEADLAVTFTLTGPQPRELHLSRSTQVASPAGGGPPAQLRGAALAQLAELLADEAVSSFLYAPTGAPVVPGVEP